MATAIQFKKAVKFESKGRVALVGPAGSGKSFTALVIARMLVGPEGKIAAVDTEHGSLSKYAHTKACGGPGVCEDPSHFDFDVVELSSFSPENFMAALKAAESAGYDAFLADSLSHFWMGKDGALEFVDMASKKNRDQMGGWKDFRPHERAMVDAMIASPMHVVCTMRTKTDYQEIVVDGKKKRVKIGLAPVQRDGLEYEFDLVGYMDDENTLIVDKTRCSALAGKALTKPSMKDLEVFRLWLAGDQRPADPAPVQPPSTPPGRPVAVESPKPWSYNLNILNCQPLSAQKMVARSNNQEYIAVKLNGRCEGQHMAFCWHAGLFNAVLQCNDRPAQFQVELSGGYLNITDVDFIEGVEYRDGQPYIEPTPPTGGTSNGSLFITDADIPF